MIAKFEQTYHILVEDSKDKMLAKLMSFVLLYVNKTERYFSKRHSGYSKHDYKLRTFVLYR